MGFPFENATWEGLEGAMYMGANSNATLICTLVAAGICVLYSGTAIAANKNSIKSRKVNVKIQKAAL